MIFTYMGAVGSRPLGGKFLRLHQLAQPRMSEYCKSLEGVAKQRYTKKINLLGLQEEDEPYSERSLLKFIDDLTLWPPVEYGHIFCYFVHNTKQELMQWKSLQAYNYFQSGLVDLNCTSSVTISNCRLHLEHHSSYVGAPFTQPTRNNPASYYLTN